MTVRVQRYATLDSTNSEAKRLVDAGAGEGTVIVAEYQTAGRGRGDHTWHSPTGGLYFTVVLRARPGGKVTDLTFVTGVALAETVKSMLPQPQAVTLKWPNDCLVRRRKVAGVLGESLGTPDHLAAVGVGINVAVDAAELAPFRANRFPATSLRLEGADASVTTEAVLQSLLAVLFPLHARYMSQGLQPILPLWESHCAFVGKRVTLAAGAGYRALGRSGAEAEPVRAVCAGVDEDGALVLSTAPGERRHYFSGELVDFED